MATKQLSRVIHTLRRAALPYSEPGLSDGQLLDVYIRSRQELAFAALVHRHGPMVWGVCRRILPCHQDAEDAFQATFLVLVRKAASVVPRDMIANWLYGVARQTALKARATTARRRQREKLVPSLPEPVLAQPRPDDDLRLLLDQELGRLPAKYRAVIVLCDLEGKTRKDAAQYFHLPEGTVATRLATARAMLAKRLARSGAGVSAGALATALSQSGAQAALPASVAANAIKAASWFAAGPRAAVEGVSIAAALLADQVLRSMWLAQLKIAAAVLLGVAILGAGAAVVMPRLLPGQAAEQRVADKGERQTQVREETGFWPQWRGPNRDGIVHGVTVPAKWPETLKQEWQVEVGAGVASPVVAGGKVYVFTRHNEDEVVRCLDLLSGKESWRSAPYPAPYKQGAEERNVSTGPRATPSVAGDRIYTRGISGILSCLNARTGALLWRQSCKPNIAAVAPDYGGSSPLLTDGLCIVHAGDGERGGLTAFDAMTGERRWCFAEGYSPMSGSPIVVDLAGERQVVTYSASNAAGVSLATGQMLWRVGSEGVGQPHTTPVQYRDLLILADILQPLRAIRLVKSGKGITAEEVWKSKALPLGYSSPVIAGDLIFGMASRQSGCLFCLDAATGLTRWESDGRQGDYASILNAGSVWITLTEKGRLIVLKPSAMAYEPIAQYQVSDTDTHAHPVFLGDRILIKDAATLRSLRIENEDGNHVIGAK
jgi:RNA polymerase sigma factor (sigma-70 family)